jgi:hypothetical protein
MTRKMLAEKHGHKGVEYGIREVGNPTEWKWTIYPKIGSGIAAKHGRVTGTREEAAAACKAAIEQAFHKRALR